MASAPLQVTMASAPVQDSKLRLILILIGKTGTGKSSTGNTILGKEFFLSEVSPDRVTQICNLGRTERFGRQWHVIDTPGVFGTGTEQSDRDEEIRKCIGMSIPGPHAFLIVLRIGRFTEEDITTIANFAKIFGEDMFRFAIVLFTGEDDLEADRKKFDCFLKRAPKMLQSVVSKCRNRVLCLNNRADNAEKEEKVKELQKLIDGLIRENNESYYTNEMYELAMNKVEEEKQRERERHEEEKQRERERHEEELQRERKIHEEELQREKERHKEELQRERTRFEKDKKRERKRHEEEKQRERKRLEEEKQRERKRLEEEKQRERERPKEEKQRESKRFKEEKQRERERHEEELQRERKRHEEELQREKERHKEELQRESKRFEEDKQGERKRHEEEKQGERERLDEENQRERERHEEELQKESET